MATTDQLNDVPEHIWRCDYCLGGVGAQRERNPDGRFFCSDKCFLASLNWDAAHLARLKERLQHLIGVVSLYVDTRYIERQLTTEEKDIWADAIDAWKQVLHKDEDEVIEPYERWWRDVSDTPAYWQVSLRDSGVDLFTAPTWEDALRRAHETIFLSGTPVRITAQAQTRRAGTGPSPGHQ